MAYKVIGMPKIIPTVAPTPAPTLPPPPFDKLANARKISMTGDVVYQQSFDGSSDVTGSATLSNTGVAAGTYPVLTVDGKGRAVSGRALATTDIPSDLMNRIKYLESMVTILSSKP